MRRIVLPLVAAAFAAAGAASAQPAGGRDRYDPPTSPGAGPPDAQNSYDQGDGEDERSAPAGAGPGYGGADRAAPDLARDLGLAPGQRAALQAYQAATTPTAAEQSRMEADARALAGMTTPQRLDAIAAQMRRDEGDFARRADAVRRFYAQLTPAQQRRFDQLTGPDAGPEGGGSAGYGDTTAAPPPR